MRKVTLESPSYPACRVPLPFDRAQASSPPLRLRLGISTYEQQRLLCCGGHKRGNPRLACDAHGPPLLSPLTCRGPYVPSPKGSLVAVSNTTQGEKAAKPSPPRGGPKAGPTGRMRRSLAPRQPRRSIPAPALPANRTKNEPPHQATARSEATRGGSFGCILKPMYGKLLNILYYDIEALSSTAPNVTADRHRNERNMSFLVRAPLSRASSQNRYPSISNSLSPEAHLSRPLILLIRQQLIAWVNLRGEPR